MPPAATTALVLVDLQNAFCHPRGSFCGRFGPPRDVPATLRACRQLHGAARRRKLLTVFTQLTYAADYHDAGLLVSARAPAIRDCGGYKRGSWDAAIAKPLRPAPTDLLLPKTRYDPFLHTPLESLLRDRGIAGG